MKNISSELSAHVGKATTTLATCWKVTRTDGQIFGFTDFSRDLVISGVTYKARTGYTRTAIETNSALAVDNLDLEGAFSDVAITELDLNAGLWDYAQVQIFQVNRADLTQGVLKLRTGRIGEVKADRGMFTTELRGLLQNVQQNIGRVFGPGCDADFGDPRCGLNLASFTVTGTITGVTSRQIFADSARTEADGFFNYGKITFTSGDNNGLSMEVKTSLNAGGAITLQLPMPFAVQADDTYSMRRGCAKDRPACIGYSNIVNFRGFPDVPGTDQMVSGGL